MEDLDQAWEFANETGTLSLRDACFPLIAQYLLENEHPDKFNDMGLAEFEHIFGSSYLEDQASEKQKLEVIFKGLDVSSCSLEDIGHFLDSVDFTQIPTEFLMDFIFDRPFVTANKELR